MKIFTVNKLIFDEKYRKVTMKDGLAFEEGHNAGYLNVSGYIPDEEIGTTLRELKRLSVRRLTLVGLPDDFPASLEAYMIHIPASDVEEIEMIKGHIVWDAPRMVRYETRGVALVPSTVHDRIEAVAVSLGLWHLVSIDEDGHITIAGTAEYNEDDVPVRLLLDAISRNMAAGRLMITETAEPEHICIYIVTPGGVEVLGAKCREARNG